MKPCAIFRTLCCCLAPISAALGQATSIPFTITATLQVPSGTHARATAAAAHLPPAVLWLVPLSNPHPTAFSPRSDYELLQKNKMFFPHLLVVPVGASVAFPNRDPFFHNVFSLFDGKRFDLGLYESGKTKHVTFSREGVSYIFCNIHPEMSAVVISLTTPLFSVADASGQFAIAGITEGDYESHLWVEGQPQTTIDRWIRKVHISAEYPTLGVFLLPTAPPAPPHTNKFGQTYTPESRKPY